MSHQCTAVGCWHACAVGAFPRSDTTAMGQACSSCLVHGRAFVFVGGGCTEFLAGSRPTDQDPDTGHIPLGVLLSDEYNDSRRALIDPMWAAAGLTPGVAGLAGIDGAGDGSALLGKHVRPVYEVRHGDDDDDDDDDHDQ